jgi:hypothetical protein
VKTSGAPILDQSTQADSAGSQYEWVTECDVNRVRGEYLEMPGLRLTLAQAARLWQMDRRACEYLLLKLVARGVLRRTGDGAFVAAA